MGNTEQRKHVQEITLSINHKYLKNATIVYNNHQSFIKLRVAISKNEYSKWIERLQKYKHTNFSRLFLPLQYSFQNGQYCGNTGSTEVHYPNYSILLNLQAQDRKRKKKSFTEQEIWYLLLTILKAKQQMAWNQTLLGDIRPENIMINEEGLIKIAIDHTWPYYTSKNQQLLNRINVFISPEEVQILKAGKINEDSVKHTGQMFSLGFTLLSIGNLDPQRSLYIYQNESFDHNNYNQSKANWMNNKNYSLILKSIVMNLVSYEAGQRMTYEQLSDVIYPHEKQIAKKLNFVINNIPNKLRQQIDSLQESMKTNKSEVMSISHLSQSSGYFKSQHI